MDKLAYLILASLLFLGGCSKSHVTTQLEAFAAPKFDELMPEYITGIKFRMDRHLDVSETVIDKDSGLPLSTSFPFYLCSPEQVTLEGAKKYYAINARYDSQNLLLAFLPERRETLKNHRAFVTDRAGKRLYSPTGDSIPLPDWDKAKIENLKEYVWTIGDIQTIEAKKGTEQYEGLLELMKPFSISNEEKWQEAIEIRNEYMKAYGIPVGSLLTDEQKELLMEDDSFKERMYDLLLDNWYGIITYPLWTPEQYGMSILISKVFQIPTSFWKEDLNKPGFMDRNPDAKDVANMILYHADKYELNQQEVATLKKMLARKSKE